MKAGSVGFMENTKGRWLDKDMKETDKAENRHTYEFGEVELLEFSIVNIPANPEALVMQKDFENRTLKAEKAELIDGLKKEKTAIEVLEDKTGWSRTSYGWTNNTMYNPTTSGLLEEQAENELIKFKAKLENKKRKIKSKKLSLFLDGKDSNTNKK